MALQCTVLYATRTFSNVIAFRLFILLLFALSWHFLRDGDQHTGTNICTFVWSHHRAYNTYIADIVNELDQTHKKQYHALSSFKYIAHTQHLYMRWKLIVSNLFENRMPDETVVKVHNNYFRIAMHKHRKRDGKSERMAEIKRKENIIRPTLSCRFEMFAVNVNWKFKIQTVAQMKIIIFTLRTTNPYFALTAKIHEEHQFIDESGRLCSPTQRLYSTQWCILLQNSTNMNWYGVHCRTVVLSS